ncbi:BnaC01g42760D [Brassica napus]|uniref:BnaC01g42760D protein n=2 Tax=Brassica TaxID=3705 RepID=A0A078IU99_BRANA|nr:BnaC01g42760D [Brassica napus]
MQDDTYLIWYCGRKEKRLKLNSVTRIIPGQGQRTSVFRRYPQPAKEYQSFSLIYGNRSLDLVFKDKNEAEFWITTLRTLLSRNSSSALVLHSRSRSFVLDYGEQSSSSNNFRSAGSDTSCEASRSHINTPQRFVKVFSEVLSQTSVLRSLSLDELVHKPHNMSPENLETRPTNHSHAGPQEMVSSAVSSSSQGSIIENLKSLCDVFVWGESIGDGLLHCKKTQTAKFYLRKRGFMRN